MLEDKSSADGKSQSWYSIAIRVGKSDWLEGIASLSMEGRSFRRKK